MKIKTVKNKANVKISNLGIAADAKVYHLINTTYNKIQNITNKYSQKSDVLIEIVVVTAEEGFEVLPYCIRSIR